MLAGGLFSAPLLCADLYDGWVGFLPAAGALLPRVGGRLCCAIGGNELVGSREAGGHVGPHPTLIVLNAV
ncbi:hypothetical protein F1728_03150 [Gimesia benthica]|uniref:Uncharacterized protein n=1 Tax=Gimesia benthica TaxID=2608982 RepID=A0A6I6A6M7_9PLAN|nr:hypothetical protein [Gimesia benthica]QGQ21743.1 hypothetical protein F1728_03150 [Gimesia benthica]